MFPGVCAFGFVTWSQAFETWPSTPPSAFASARMARIGATTRTASSIRPAACFAFAEAGRSAERKPATSPSASSATSITSVSAPSSCPASSRTASGSLSVVRPVSVNVQKISGAAPAVAPRKTIAPRSRSGTIANHASRPAASASSEPREYESISTSSSSAMPGHASAFAGAQPDRRAPSQISGGIPSAAIRPTEFQ